MPGFAPKKVIKWMRQCYAAPGVANNWSVVVTAISDGREDVLRWLAEQKIVTAEYCRRKDRLALKIATEKRWVWALEWLREQGAATAEDCWAAGCQAAAARTDQVELLEWLEKTAH